MKANLIASVMLCGLWAVIVAGQQSAAEKSAAAEAQLGAAIHQEEAEGNLDAAIASYKRFLAQHGNNRALAAKAHYHLGLAYEKLGNAEAGKSYERVVRDYADQAELSAAARRRLAALGARSSDTLTLRHVYTTKAFEMPASITPDGRLMGLDGGNIGLRDVATGRIRWLVDGDTQNIEAQEPVISPDQRQVAYAWYANKPNGELYGELRIIRDEPGSKPRVVIPANEDFRFVDPAAWSLDGKSILIIINRRDHTWQLGWVSVGDGS